MKSLAKGTNSDAIFKLIKVLINTQQSDYQMAVQGDTTEIEDVVDKLETDQELFATEEKANGTVLNESVLRESPKKSPSKKSPTKGSPSKEQQYKLGIPSYVEDQIRSKEDPEKN
mmetsp:Transcript_13177/g.20519  ORF Transcript_13177/g.20519 Transcript_13177/m.20519 type:complete len:115 (+) Transcript_13177:257-601(+)